MTLIKNEVRRYVACFRNFLADGAERELYPFGPETRLFVAGDAQPDGSTSYSLVGDAEWSYRLIDILCGSRVIDAEFGRLVANGKRLSAEKYLGLWRAAENQRLTVSELIALGITPVQHLTLPTETCKKKEYAAELFDSPLLVRTDDACSIWDIPLDTVDNVRLAARLRSVWWSNDQEHMGFRKEVRLRVNQMPVQVKTPQAALTAELFTEAA